MRYWLSSIDTVHETEDEDETIAGSEPDERLDELVRQYELYFKTIKHSLPPDLLLFADRQTAKIYLNDSSLLHIAGDCESQTVTITLQGDAEDEVQRYIIGTRLFTLRYQDVTGWEYQGKATRFGGLDGDHLFDEIQIIADGVIQHRMYFSGEIEVAVRFRAFSFEYQDTLHPPSIEAQPPAAQQAGYNQP